MTTYHSPNPYGKGLKPNYSSWQNSQTKPIRLPEVLIPQILEYAHSLDKGVPAVNNPQEGKENIKEVISILEDCLDPKQYPANKGGAIKKRIKEALELLR